MSHTPLRVGFDLDGVLLYNPARIFRPITVTLKKLLKRAPKKSTHFYYPKSPIEQWLWTFVHYSSLFISPGYEDIQKLIKDGKIEAYIVTSRYDCLLPDFNRWLNNLHASEYFKGTFHNKNNVQPHVFKELKVNELQLDYFVEDNWDIVSHLNETTNAKTLWISNTIDWHIPYPTKYLSLKDAVTYLASV